MENLQIKDLVNYKFISKLQYSPSGSHAAFIVSKANWDENGYDSNLFLIDAKTENITQLTYSNEVKDFLWYSNEEIIFPALRKEADKAAAKKGEKLTVFHKLSLKGGEAGEFFRLPYTVTTLKVMNSETGCFAITCQCHPSDYDFKKMDETEKAITFKKIEEEKDYEVLDEIPFWSNGGGFTNKKRNRLFIYELNSDADGGKITAVSDELSNIGSVKTSGSQVVYTANSFKDKMGLKHTAHVYDHNTGKTENLVEPDLFSISYIDFFDGGFVMKATGGDKFGMNQNPDFYTIKNNIIKLLCKPDESVGSYTNSDSRLFGGINLKVYNNEIYYTAPDHVFNVLRKINKAGEITTLIHMYDTVDAFDVSDNGIMYYGLGDVYLHEIFKLEHGKPRKLSEINTCSLAGKKLSAPERFDAMGKADTIEGFVIKPVDYDPNKKYPAVLSMHGGPKTAFGNSFFHEMQVLANMGYFVLLCNPFGSDGRGDIFADLRGLYGTIDYDDFMAYTDKCIEAYPQIDAKRIAVTGGSYGGYMTNWIIGHTDRFCCGASQRSISNWISKFGTTDIGYFFNADQQCSTPWDNHDKLWWHSPLKYADQCKTPTLFIHSEEDYRCWLAEGLQMYTALKYHGVDARLCMFRGENHELSRSGKPKHRVRRLTEITNWFEKYCK